MLGSYHRPGGRIKKDTPPLTHGTLASVPVLHFPPSPVRDQQEGALREAGSGQSRRKRQRGNEGRRYVSSQKGARSRAPGTHCLRAAVPPSQECLEEEGGLRFPANEREHQPKVPLNGERAAAEWGRWWSRPAGPEGPPTLLPRASASLRPPSQLKGLGMWKVP